MLELWTFIAGVAFGGFVVGRFRVDDHLDAAIETGALPVLVKIERLTKLHVRHSQGLTDYCAAMEAFALILNDVPIAHALKSPEWARVQECSKLLEEIRQEMEV